ncbi:chemotaxis protein CheB [Novosphingobium taihuense]|uniref:protein-glutamate methylesterase n=1 Tax=Novosphingobium taihuense TaxID=260085 RepID=A0A7W7ABV7_9SPHN|nr:chemotaxis protein CheB [Novosphingobium taihuense]MBB4613410.1 two-component system chemotaxis response regulator CheB [Novosphingobium taihuense]TWH80916.1 two-component system chemotaxis response regulator CheB [Novosphingobium taihuense]
MNHDTVRAVAIGASAGAVQALLHILPSLPAALPVPVMIVVHVPADRDNTLVPLLDTRCQLAVKEAEDKEPAMPGTVYFAPSDYHLLVEKDGSLALSGDEPVNYSRPAIDVLLESAAEAFGSGLVGIVLTGANHDGAAGLRAVAAGGGIAIVQDPASAMSATMPAAALALCPDARVETLDGITAFLSGLVHA